MEEIDIPPNDDDDGQFNTTAPNQVTHWIANHPMLHSLKITSINSPPNLMIFIFFHNILFQYPANLMCTNYNDFFFLTGGIMWGQRENYSSNKLQSFNQQW